MRRVLPWATACLAVALLVAGALVFALTPPSTPVDVGWYAYAPLAPETTEAYSSTVSIASDDSRMLWSDGGLLGAGLGVAGLLLLAALAGWAFGRRARGAPRAG